MAFCSEPIKNQSCHHKETTIETSFYMMPTLAFNELMIFEKNFIINV